jgi:hypothetical protein
MAQTDILVSGAWLWYAPEGEPNPDETTIDVGDDWGANWEWLGLTTAPLTLNLTAEEFEVDVQQLSTPILSSITSETVTLTTTLAEQTAENLDLIFGGNTVITPAGAAQRGFTELRFGGRTTRTVYKIGFEVIHTIADGTRLPLRLFFHRAQIGLSGDIAYDKANVAGLPINVTVLSDDSQPADEKLAVWQKVTSDTTA